MISAFSAFSAFAFPVGDYYFDQPWTIANVTYTLTLRFNMRANAWFLDIADATSQPILSGIALRAGRNLLTGHPNLPLPKGVLFVYDSTGANQDPGPDSFSSTHLLVFGAYS